MFAALLLTTSKLERVIQRNRLTLGSYNLRDSETNLLDIAWNSGSRLRFLKHSQVRPKKSADEFVYSIKNVLVQILRQGRSATLHPNINTNSEGLDHRSGLAMPCLLYTSPSPRDGL